MERLLEHLYASVLDPARFEDFAATLAHVMNAHLVALQTDDAGHHHNVQRHCFGTPTPESTTHDFANDASINAFFVKGATAFVERGVLDGNTMFEPGELERTAFYQVVLAEIDVHHSMAFCIDAAPNGMLTALSVSRDRRRPAFEQEVMTFSQRLLPHLRNVHQLTQRLMQLERTASILDYVGCGVWLLGTDGRILRTNAVGQEWLSHPDAGLRQRGPRLKATWPADQAALDAAITRGTSPMDATRSDILLHDSRAQPWASCSIHPVGRNTFDGLLPGIQAACILLIHRFSAAMPTHESTLRAIFGLTPAEAELAAALLRKGSLGACASSSTKSIETLRSQLKALFAKTETHHQAELLQRLQAALG